MVSLLQLTQDDETLKVQDNVANLSGPTVVDFIMHEAQNLTTVDFVSC